MPCVQWHSPADCLSSHADFEHLHADCVPDPRFILLGIVGSGIEGWHVDGNCGPGNPHAATVIHAVHAIDGGDTKIVPLTEVVANLRDAAGVLDNRLDGVSFRSAHDHGVVHPLVYPHPVTGNDTMMFGFGSLATNFLRWGEEMSESETANVIGIVTAAIEASAAVLTWRWKRNDLLVLDNLALAHVATLGTQTAKSSAGLRLMQRTTAMGRSAPARRRRVAELGPDEQGCTSSGTGGTGVYCIASLHRVLQLTTASPRPPGDFASREASREMCRQLVGPGADLAMLKTRARNALAATIVSAVAEPHWIGGDDGVDGTLRFVDGTEFDHASTWKPPWHTESGQPNDCDGPGSEPCMFMGPNGRWFDFACAAKAPSADAGTTPGPEITWRPGHRRMYSLFPLCGVAMQDTDAARAAGFRTSRLPRSPRPADIDLATATQTCESQPAE